MHTIKTPPRLVHDSKSVHEITKKISNANKKGEKLLMKSLKKELKLYLTEKRRRNTDNFNKKLNLILKGNPKQYFNKIKSLFNKKRGERSTKVTQV